MKVGAVVVVVSVVVFMATGCSSSPTLEESSSPTSEPTTSTTSPGASTSPSTSKPTAAPETQPVERRLTGFSWEATWTGHRIASDITISVDDRSVAASFGETQDGQLTEFGAGEIQRLVDEVSLEKTPETFAGPERWDWANESTFAITLTVGGEATTYRYTGTPPPQLSALDCFLWNQIRPLSFCESTDAVEVQEPCTYLGVD